MIFLIFINVSEFFKMNFMKSMKKTWRRHSVDPEYAREQTPPTVTGQRTMTIGSDNIFEDFEG